MTADVRRNRWVRFHSLPESKRYADTDAEYAVLLWRHNALLRELGADGDCFVITACWDGDLAMDPPTRDASHPGATLWRTFPAEDPEAPPTQLWASVMVFPSPELDGVLLAVADEKLDYTTIGPPDLQWLYQPYDGGGDVIAPSSDVRDQLKVKYSSWLPSHPSEL